MAEKVIIETELRNDQPVAQVKNLKTQLRELKQEQAQAALAFGENSKQVTEVSKKIADLADLQEDLNRKSTAYKSDPFDKAVFTLNGLAAGFQAAAGAAAVFGAESDDVQKSLLRVQGAVALSQGIMDITDMAKAYNLFSKTTIVNVIKSLGTLRGALIATGIGAAAVAVGLLVANWEKVVKIVRDFIGLGPSQSEILATQTKQLETQNKLFELNADKYDEFTQRKIKANLEYKKSINDNAKAVQEGTMTEQEARAFNAMAADKYNRELIKSDQDRAKATLEANQKISDDLKKKEEERKKLEDEKKKRDEEIKKSNDEYAKLADERFTKDMDNSFMQLEQERLADEQLAKLGRAGFEESMKRYDAEQSAIKNNLAAEQAANEYKKQITQDSITAMSAIANALGASDNVSKAFALGQIAYDTATALTKALSVTQSPSPDNVATGGLAGIAKYTSIAAMIAVNASRAISIVNSKRPQMGAMANPLSAPTLNAPRLPIQGTQVEGAGDRTAGNSMRVYVVESDIRNTQNRIDVIESNSTIG